MNNLHRELAPISDSAWTQIEEEVSRTIKRYLAGRRIADVQGPAGSALSAVGTGHLRAIAASGERVTARQREAKALVELRVPFELDREMIDDVERGANDSDWQPAKDAARALAFAEDRAIFEGYDAAGIVGVRQGTSHPQKSLPVDVRKYPEAFAQALSQLRMAGVNGPYSILLSADAYTELAETSDYGYPVLEHVKRLVEGKIIWAPAIDGAFVVTARGGDLDLHIGQDASIGYLSHTDRQVRLYLQETFTFLYLTSESAVAFSPPAKS
jgi:uncharacterized linocin/CFP29 family protein